MTTTAPTSPPAPRRGRALLWGLVALALVGAGLALYSFRGPLLHGSVEPPEPDTSRMERPLVRRLEERLAAVRAEPYSAEAWGRLGVAFDVHDLFEEGIFCYERARELDPDEVRWPYFLGICTRLGDREASLTYLQQAAELGFEHAPLYYFIGDGLLGSEDLDGARRAFERAVEIDAELVAAHLGLAKIALTLGQPESALPHLEEALEHDPQTTEVHSLFVEAYRQAGDAEAMARHAALESDAIDFEPVNDQLRFELLWTERVTLRWRRERTEVHMDEGRYEQALTEALAAVRDAPDSVEAQIGLGHVYFRTDRAREAIAAYERAAALDPNDAQAWLSLGAAHRHAGNTGASRAASERALELDPKLHQARNNLGTILFQEGEAERGLELIEASCREMPNDVEAHFNWAMALRATGRLERAVEVFSIAAQIDPGHFQSHFELGLTLARLQRLEEAVREFRAAAAADPRRAEAHEGLVRALEQLGRQEEALAACRAALKAVPGHMGLSHRLSWMLATSPVDSLRDGAQSLALARQLAEGPGRGHPMALHGLAAALAETGDFPGAARTAREALELLRTRPAPPGAEARFAELAVELEDCLGYYENGQPYRARP